MAVRMLFLQVLVPRRLISRCQMSASMDESKQHQNPEEHHQQSVYCFGSLKTVYCTPLTQSLTISASLNGFIFQAKILGTR
jgi:hypothetical protein